MLIRGEVMSDERPEEAELGEEGSVYGILMDERGFDV